MRKGEEMEKLLSNIVAAKESYESLQAYIKNNPNDDDIWEAEKEAEALDTYITIETRKLKGISHG